MRKLILAPVLALTLAASAAAGDMQFGDSTGLPAPTPTPETMTVVGHPSMNRTITTEEVNNLTATLLNLIASVLALV